mgnify:CR=1 FL=1
MAVLITINVVVLTQFSDTSQKLVESQSTVVKTKNELQGHSEARRELEKEKTVIESSLKEERLKTENLNKENDQLKANLQAKKEAQAKLASVTVQKQTIAPAPTVTVTGDKQSWLAASGIPQSEWGYVDSIVTRESGWNPNAVNPSSGACGLGQQLPCGKWAGAWNDPVAALRAMNGYVHGRYGGWAGAVAFWQANRWY